jgi:ectoine hydroxylase-related dioxygenase (phytanoyl-CoA dioxygenase family)
MAPREISNDEAKFFLDNGYLIVRNVIAPEELSWLRTAMDELTAFGSEQVRDDPDFAYGDGHVSGKKVLRRIEYVIDKRDECKALLGHPFILRSVEKLMGPDFIPTWDSMVLKLPGEGIVVPWHRDAGTEFVGDKPIFNVDFYLDEADENTCVWVIPGSHKWSAEQAKEGLARRKEFTTDGAAAALMQPGDVLFHNILVLHGSPANISQKLRRVIYYEFRAAHVEESLGPHIPAYLPLKQKALLACIAQRKRTPYIKADETPFNYCPPPPFNTVTLADGETLPTFRYLHQDFWRK